MGCYNTVEEFDRACEREDAGNEVRLAWIRKMLANDVPIATIIDVTDWLEEDILAVAKQMKKS
jgi:hypothetical protein